MSIESNLKRIADALEKIAVNTQPGTFDTPAVTSADIVTQVPETTGDPVAAPAPAPTAAPAPAPTTTEAPAPAPAMTPEELNAKLVIEFKRLGKRDAIDTALAEFGVAGVTSLTVDQYQPLLTKVQSIPA